MSPDDEAEFFEAVGKDVEPLLSKEDYLSRLIAKDKMTGEMARKYCSYFFLYHPGISDKVYASIEPEADPSEEDIYIIVFPMLPDLLYGEYQRMNEIGRRYGRLGFGKADKDS